MEEYTTKCISVTLDGYSGNDTYITCTEWKNGEGISVSIECGAGQKLIELHHDELGAIVMMANRFSLRLKDDKEKEE